VYENLLLPSQRCLTSSSWGRKWKKYGTGNWELDANHDIHCNDIIFTARCTYLNTVLYSVENAIQLCQWEELNSWPGVGDPDELNTLRALELCCQCLELCVETSAPVLPLTFRSQTSLNPMLNSCDTEISARCQNCITIGCLTSILHEFPNSWNSGIWLSSVGHVSTLLEDPSKPNPQTRWPNPIHRTQRQKPVSLV